MEYRTLGRTGVKVSCLGLGTLTFGNETDEKAAQAMFRRCLEAGVNFFDTADAYADGRAEEILGRLVADAGCRGEIVLASKGFYPTGKDVNARGLSRRHLRAAVEGSLRRLRTDHLDLYFLHNFDPDVSMEEPLRALEDLGRQGKILYPAASNWAAWQMAKALGISARNGWVRLECIEPMYNLVKRMAEVEILPLARSEGLGVVTYGPLGGGLLTGKYGTQVKPERGRIVETATYARRYGDSINLEVAERFTHHARERGVHPAALAVAWVMSHPAVTAPIVGARNLEQLEPSLAAADIPMTPEWRDEISALSPEPPPYTDRSEEKSGIFFVSGRPR